jgi:acyl transferase domain-containing protein/NADPH:quinone reductase-like Zn-dependent oxidoreductase/NADP-dependent 3-hydroxy acid dehydrogenase YdfG/aryl carrier-like protein
MTDARTDADRSTANADALRRALVALRDLRARLAQAKQAAHEPVAIVGMGCRFPGGSSSPDRYWQLLNEGREALRDVPRDRWRLEDFYDANPDSPGKMYARTGGFLDEALQEFDARFFGISPREAESLDPQQRLLLETSWEALEHAGIAPTSLAGTDAGVFVGIGTADVANLRQRYTDANVIDPYAGTGSGYCTASGRLSFFLGLHGPNIAIDTACSSSLVSVLLAIQSLRTRGCSLAIAGGVNAMISPFTTVYMCNLRALSTAGRCATFDDSADGYARGEGCGMVVLKRLSDAERDGDTIHAIIRGGAYNHDGRSAGLTVPNGMAQRAVLRLALADASLTPADVQYVEAHGTGTPLGDPIELHALADVYGADRHGPLVVGSVKTNMGHLEAAAGIAGVIKCALSFEHDSIPRHLNFHTPNSRVDWSTLPIEVATRARAWSNDTRRVAGVSSFGISGTNAHILLEASPRQIREHAADGMLPFQLIPLSAVDTTALASMAGNLADAIETSSPLLADVALTHAVGRAHFRERTAIVADSNADAVRQLRLVAAGALDQIAAAGHVGADAPRVAFIFTGQGAQYAGMGAALDAAYPVFRDAIDRCAAAVDARLTMPLRSVLFPRDGASSPIDETAFTQPALFAVEFALAELLASWGVRPRLVMGHSIGEYVAAVVAGALPLEAALALVCERGRLMQSLPAGGAMGAVALPEAQVRELLHQYPSLDLAAVNSPTSCVVSGPADDVQSLIDSVKASGEHATRLSVSHAFHSRMMEPILDDFRRAAAGLVASEPTIDVISNRTGDVIGATQLGDASYWADHLRGTVRFANGVSTLGKLGADLIIEVGPTPALLGQARESLPNGNRRWLATLRRDRNDHRAIEECVAGSYAGGVAVDWPAMHAVQPSRRIELPTYPWQRERFWKDLLSPERRTRPGVTRRRHPLLGGRIAGPRPTFEGQVSVVSPAYLGDHRIFGLPLYPATGYIELALAAARETGVDGDVMLRNIMFREALRLPDATAATMQVLLHPGNDGAHEFHIFSRSEIASGAADAPAWLLHASGEIAPTNAAPGIGESLDAIRARCTVEHDAAEQYEAMRGFGGDYGPRFRAVTEIRVGAFEALGTVNLPQSERESAEAYRIHPALLDACFQLTAAAISAADEGEEHEDTYVPVGISGLRVYQPGMSDVFCHVTIPNSTTRGQAIITCDLTLLDADGHLVAEVDTLSVRRLSRSTLHALVGHTPLTDSVYQLAWQAADAAEIVAPQPGAWLIVADEAGVSTAIASELRSREHTASTLRLADAFAATDDGWQIDPASSSDVHRAISAANSKADLRGVVVVWPFATPDAEPSLAALSVTQERALRATLSIAQSLEALSVPMWIVTRGSQVFPGAVPDVAQATLWGLGGVIAAENPALRCQRIDLDPRASVADMSHLVDALWMPSDEDAIAFRDGVRLVARLEAAARTPSITDGALRLEIAERGQLENLSLVPAARPAPGPDEVEIEVRAAGLNFRDVLNALGAYPGDPGPLGNECSGVITAIGSAVTELRVGDEVISMPQGGFATHVLSKAVLTVRKPSALTFAQAACVPVAFLTAHYALSRLGEMQSGDRVLIHAAMGGVGMAAMQLARRAGAVVVGTAGSPAKRARATQLGAAVVADSRSPQFDAVVRDAFDGDGVDIVLNSLAGDFIPNSLRLLRASGRFIELGKTDIWDEKIVAEQFPGVSYHVFFLGELAYYQPLLVRELLLEIVADFASGALTPLPMHVFPLARAEDAFRFMAQARHSGKIVITPPAPTSLRDDATYLITGGLGGLGLTVAKALADDGARHLVLMGRRAPNATAVASIAELTRRGVDVVVESADIASPSDLEAVLSRVAASGFPLRGVIHSAGVIDDAVLADLDWTRMSAVLSPKVMGGWNLHQQTRELSLDFFILFSSVAALMSGVGQGNYAAANQFLDALAESRAAQGLPALSINWGSWDVVGMAANVDEAHRRRWAAAGLRMIAPDDGVSVMRELMARAVAPRVAVLPLDLQQSGNAVPPLLRHLVTRPKSDGRDPVTVDILSRLRATPAADRLSALQAMLTEQVMRVLAPNATYRPDPDRGLLELGMDSLMAIELRNRVASHLDVAVSVGELMQGPTLQQLATSVLQRMSLSSDADERNAATVGSNADAVAGQDWESGSL